MALFQEKILKKFLVSDEIITEKFQNYLKYKAKAQEVREMKEEEFQDGFLRDIFESCLDFTLKSTNPKNFNLEREKKNEKDSKKADGAILIDGKVVGVIELKSYKTSKLDEVARQAFWYLSQNSQANYVMISNFDELRFYINKATKYEKFKLFSLDFEEFKKLYTILSLESIKENLPLKMQNESQEFEQNITKEFYKIFSKFRNELFENLVKNNENSDKIELLNASSKLCDRFIFMLFAKDRNLLPRNIFNEIYRRFDEDLESRPLYFFFKFYFEAINSGKEKLEIQAYNGGLFAADEFLNELKIDDEILKNNLEKLNSYDFESEISVNILGHIFEQSLSDLEEIESKLNAENFDKTTSKRKKDGVFYTPNFITTFIVENSLGKLCEDKKEEFNLAEILENLKENKEKLTKIEGKKGKIASDERKILELKQEENLKILEKYKTWLLSLKIIDPACGSGAFLNEALEFLIKEHENLKAEMANAGNLFYGENIDISILENNLFGVDINSQAVEIAKLSLWLRTAKKGRKLTKLSDNLKSGNSLIDDKNLVENAFVWKEEFPEVFANGGFDIVIGNPPYIKEYTNKKAFDGLRESPYYQGKMDLWYFFACQALDIVKENGLISFIAPNNWISNAGASKMRNKILEDGKILKFIDFGAYKVFEDAGIQTMIYIMQKTKDNLSYNLEIAKILDKNLSQGEVISFLSKIPNEKFAFFTFNFDKAKFLNKTFTFVDNRLEIILNKIFSKQNFQLLEKEVAQGIVGAPDKAFIIQKENLQNFSLEEQKYIKKYYTNSGFYSINESDKYIIYLSDKNFAGKKLSDFKEFEKHFECFKRELEEAKIKYKTPNKEFFYLHRERDEKFFQKGSKIICPTRTYFPCNSFTDDEFYASRALNIIKTERINLKFLISILNSKLSNFWLQNKGKKTGDLLQIDKSQLLSIPINLATEKKQKAFITLVDEILTSKEKIKDYKILLAEAIENNNFDREIALKKELEKLEKLCVKNEKEINFLVYKLYDLNEEEIRIIENF